MSEELIRVAILWHEMWHEGLEEASRLYFGERNVKGMFEVLEPLHAMMERGPQTLKETSFNQVSASCQEHNLLHALKNSHLPQMCYKDLCNLTERVNLLGLIMLVADFIIDISLQICMAFGDYSAIGSMVAQIVLEFCIGWVSDKVWKAYNYSAVNSSNSRLLSFMVTTSTDSRGYLSSQQKQLI